jgi:hypothetical protein
MSAAASVLYKIYVVVKPSEERLIYKTFDAALRAAEGQIGTEIEEWHSLDSSDRLRHMQSWEIRRTGLIKSAVWPPAQ